VFTRARQGNKFVHKTAIYAIETNNYIISQNVATCFDQSCGHPQATRAHKTKNKIARVATG
jgi:hypothetical protein